MVEGNRVAGVGHRNDSDFHTPDGYKVESIVAMCKHLGVETPTRYKRLVICSPSDTKLLAKYESDKPVSSSASSAGAPRP